MKKIFLLLLVSLLSVSLFISCNSSPESNSGSGDSGSGSEDSGSGSGTPTVVPVEFTSLEGKWRDSQDTHYYLFFESPSTAQTAYYDASKSKTSITGTYTVSISGDVVTFTSGEASYSYKCTVSGNSLALVKESSSEAMPGVAHESWKKI